MNISMIVAVAVKNRVIGNEGKTPWNIPKDLEHFKKTTLGKPIIMGRKTAEEIVRLTKGRPLPGRPNIVLTRDDKHANFFSNKGFDIAPSIETALRYAEIELNAEEVVITGGEQIYKEGLPYAKTIYLTEVNIDVEGDAFFPELDMAEWMLKESFLQPEHEGIIYRFNKYVRLRSK